MNHLKLSALATVAVAALAVAGCTEKQGGGPGAGLELAKLNGVAPVTAATPFDRALFGEYSALARSEYTQGDYSDSDFYAMRALSAAQANPNLPQDVGNRKVPADKVAELKSAHDRVVNAVMNGGRTRAPSDLARAQAMYDCWLEQQAENRQPKDIANCREGFLAAIPKAELPVVQIPPQPETFTVFFDRNKATLTPRARDEIARAATRAKAMNPKSISIDGHADRSGSAAHNMKLSEQREAAVRSVLASDGLNVPVAGHAYGETRPAMQTPDGKEEPTNRRVDIILNP